MNPDYKNFRLSNLAINNRTTVVILTAMIFIFGLSSYWAMPREDFPEIITPEIYVSTSYPGNSPVDIENVITQPLEKEINNINNIDEITSTSVQGHSSIRIKFDYQVTPSEALRKVKDKVDTAMAKPDFPKDLPVKPDVFELNISELVPIMNINLSGNFSVDQLREYADYLKEKIETLREITSVNIRGVQEKEVAIHLDRDKMENMGLSFEKIASSIRLENRTISAGKLPLNQINKSIRVIGEFENIKQLENIIIKNEGDIVYLGDIAEITLAQKERKSYARAYAKPVVMLDIMKKSGENLIFASEKIKKIIAAAKQAYLPSILKIFITNDSSEKTQSNVQNLENNIIFGMLLVIAVLMLFLNLRNAIFVGIAIPLSMFLSFILLSVMGVTLNGMVLFSLVLALGMLVDNGIVVVENIYRLLSRGENILNAAKKGVGQVALPIITSTATTLAAFVPLAIWPGMTGEFMKYLPITLIIVLGSSLFVALVITPVFASMYMKLKQSKHKNAKKRFWIFVTIGAVCSAMGWVTNIVFLSVIGNLCILLGIFTLLNFKCFIPLNKKIQTQLFPYLEQKYAATLSFALKGNNAKKFFFSTIGLLFVSLILFVVFKPKILFFPINTPETVTIYIEKPIGTDIEKTKAITYAIEKKIVTYFKKYELPQKNNENHLVQSVITQVGQGASDPDTGSSKGDTPHKGKISIAFHKFEKRKGLNTLKVMNELRGVIGKVADCKILVKKNRVGPPVGAPINIEISGEDYESLYNFANLVKNTIEGKNIAGIENLQLDVDKSKPETIIKLDRDKATRLDISTSQIGNLLRSAIYGLEISRFKQGEETYPINIRYAQKYREDKNLLAGVLIKQKKDNVNVQTPLSAIAEIAQVFSFDKIKRKDLKGVITISSYVLEGYNGNQIVNQIKPIIKNLKTPPQINVKFTGEQESQAKEMKFLSKALLIALFLIFIIIVSQFNSAAVPFIIIFSVILSLIGVFLGLLIFRLDFIIIMTMIGIISLAGVVVNNAIVLIDYTKSLIEKKQNTLEENEKLSLSMVYECIVEGGKTRLRPVILTAITTILGLTPLALGMNIDFFSFITKWNPNIYFGGPSTTFWGPLSWTVIFGLTFATFLTLVIVPVMYYILYRFKLRKLAPN